MDACLCAHSHPPVLQGQDGPCEWVFAIAFANFSPHYFSTFVQLHSIFFPFKASRTLWPWPVDSCPLYYVLPPPSGPQPLFSGRILAVSSEYRSAELLLTWGRPVLFSLLISVFSQSETNEVEWTGKILHEENFLSWNMKRLPRKYLLCQTEIGQKTICSFRLPWLYVHIAKQPPDRWLEPTHWSHYRIHSLKLRGWTVVF